MSWRFNSMQRQEELGEQKFGVGILFAERLLSNIKHFSCYEIFVKGVYRGTPADRSGVREGDTLLEINGTNVKGLSLLDVAPKIVGKLNTPIQLGFRRHKDGGQSDFYAVDLIRSASTAVDNNELVRNSKEPSLDEMEDPFLTYRVKSLDDLAGIGFSIHQSWPSMNSFVIGSITTGSDAEQKGVQSGQLLVSIEGKPTMALTMPQVKVLLLGRDGDSRELELKDPNTGATRHVRVLLDCEAEFRREFSAHYHSNGARPSAGPPGQDPRGRSFPVAAANPEAAPSSGPAYPGPPSGFAGAWHEASKSGGTLSGGGIGARPVTLQSVGVGSNSQQIHGAREWTDQSLSRIRSVPPRTLPLDAAPPINRPQWFSSSIPGAAMAAPTDQPYPAPGAWFGPPTVFMSGMFAPGNGMVGGSAGYPFSAADQNILPDWGGASRLGGSGSGITFAPSSLQFMHAGPSPSAGCYSAAGFSSAPSGNMGPNKMLQFEGSGSVGFPSNAGGGGLYPASGQELRAPADTTVYGHPLAWGGPLAPSGSGVIMDFGPRQVFVPSGSGW